MLGNPTADDRQQGYALVAVLWVIMLLSLIAAAVLSLTRTETNLARNLIESGRAEALADAGVHRAIAALLLRDVAARPRADGSAYHWQFYEDDVLISVQDEAGKIDLNHAPDRLLAGLFKAVGFDPEATNRLVAAVRDYADADDLRRLNGAEDAEYIAADRPSGAKDAPFNSLDELQQVLGISRELFDTIAPALTIYSGQRNLDPRTAPRLALLAMPGATPEQVDAILQARALAAEEASLGGEGPPDMTQPEAVNTAPSRGGIVTIRATAETAGGAKFERLAVVQIGDDPRLPFTIREWRRVWSTEAAEADDGSATE